MHVRTTAWLWICDHLNVVLWCNAFLSHVWWIYLFILHKALAVFSHHYHVWKQVWPYIGPVILTATLWLILSSNRIWKAISTFYDPMMNMSKNKVQCSEQWGDLKCDQSFPSDTIEVTSCSDNSSQFNPQVHSATLPVSQSRENFFQCQGETLCKEQDFINNPFKVKCLPLQFSCDPADSKGRLRGQVVIGVSWAST